MAYPLPKPAHPLKGHKIFGKACDNKIIPIYNRVSRWKRCHFDYVHTCYKFDNMLTLYAIPFDLDLEKCSPRYIIDGKIDANLILNRLRGRYPEFIDVPMTLVRTRSGGISLLINIAPVVYTDENGDPNKNTQKTVWGLMQAQRNILKLLQNEGMGADSGAIGLARMVANYERPELVLYNNDRELLNKARRERTNLLQILLRINKTHNKISRIYNDTRVGSKLYKHFLELYEQTLEGRELIKIDRQFLLDAGIDIRTARKIVARELQDIPWLEVFKRINGEFLCKLAGSYDDWELWANDAKNYQVKKNIKIRNYKTLHEPHLVEDGERNKFLFSAAVLLAHETNNFDHVLMTLEEVASKIPNCEQSRNCKPRQLRSIVNWAIKTSQQYRRITRNMPTWLWKIHNTLEAHLWQNDSFERASRKVEAKKPPVDSSSGDSVDKPTLLKYCKIGNNYAVLEYHDNGYKLKLLGFAKTIKYLPSIATKLQIQGKVYIKDIEMLKDTIAYLPWFESYQKLKHVLCGLTNVVILHEPIIWDRLK